MINLVSICLPFFKEQPQEYRMDSSALLVYQSHIAYLCPVDAEPDYLVLEEVIETALQSAVFVGQMFRSAAELLLSIFVVLNIESQSFHHFDKLTILKQHIDPLETVPQNLIENKNTDSQA